MPALGCSWTDCVLVLYRCSPTRKGSATAWLCLMLDGQRGNWFYNTYDNVNLFAVLQVNDTYLYYGNFLTRWYEHWCSQNWFTQMWSTQAEHQLLKDTMNEPTISVSIVDLGCQLTTMLAGSILLHLRIDFRVVPL
jgi:hypothetical protein